jgi:hypothetical protein
MQTINEQDIGTNADWQKLIGEQYAKLSSTRDGYAYTNLIFPVVEYDDIPVELVLRIHADLDHAAEFVVLGRHSTTCLLFEFLQNNCDEPKAMAEELMDKYFRLRWNTTTRRGFTIATEDEDEQPKTFLRLSGNKRAKLTPTFGRAAHTCPVCKEPTTSELACGHPLCTFCLESVCVEGPATSKCTICRAPIDVHGRWHLYRSCCNWRRAVYVGLQTDTADDAEESEDEDDEEDDEEL